MNSLAVLLLLQIAAVPPTKAVAQRDLDGYPFAVGERFTYSAKLGVLSLGQGTVEVAGLDTIRGVESFLFRFTLTGGVVTYRLNDTLESWTGTRDFYSRRFVQRMDEGGKKRFKHYEIFPDSGVFHDIGKKVVRPSSAEPVDDTAFLYFVRITPLEVGRTYQFENYFRKDKNPVILRVEKRERMELPDGRKVDCLVIQPIIGEKGGLFTRQSDARVWLTDDARRLPVQIRTRFPFGTITLRMKAMELPTRPDRAGGAGS